MRMYDSDFGFMGWRGGRARRGDMMPIILRTLLKKPMHGYEIIGELEAKSHGFWRPSAGSIYPNLQLLEESGLVAGTEDKGKKVYALTVEGRTEAEKIDKSFKAPWEYREQYVKFFKEMRMTAGDIFGLLRQIAEEGSAEKYAETKSILESTREKLTAVANRPERSAPSQPPESQPPDKLMAL